MVPAPNRPWYRLHWLTWLVLAVVVWALVERERERDFSGMGGSLFSWVTFAEFGWPKAHLESQEVESRGSTEFTYRWNYSILSFNLLFCLLLTAATAHVFEIWLRSSNRLQLSLGSLLGLIGVAAILMGIVSGNINASLRWLGFPSLYFVYWTELSQPVKWPLMLALGCTIYSSGRLASLAVLRLSAFFVLLTADSSSPSAF